MRVLLRDRMRLSLPLTSFTANLRIRSSNTVSLLLSLSCATTRPFVFRRRRLIGSLGLADTALNCLVTLGPSRLARPTLPHSCENVK